MTTDKDKIRVCAKKSKQCREDDFRDAVENLYCDLSEIIKDPSPSTVLTQLQCSLAKSNTVKAREKLSLDNAEGEKILIISEEKTIKKTKYKKSKEKSKNRIREIKHNSNKKFSLADITPLVTEVTFSDEAIIPIKFYCKLCGLELLMEEAVTSKCLSKCKYIFHLICWESIVYNNMAKCPSDWCHNYINTYTYQDIIVKLEQPVKDLKEIDYTLANPIAIKSPLQSDTNITEIFEKRVSYRQEDVSEYEKLCVGSKVNKAIKRDRKLLRQQQKKIRALQKHKPLALTNPLSGKNVPKPVVKPMAINSQLNVNVSAAELPELLHDLANQNNSTNIKSVNVVVTIDDSEIMEPPMIISSNVVDESKNKLIFFNTLLPLSKEATFISAKTSNPKRHLPQNVHSPQNTYSSQNVHSPQNTYSPIYRPSSSIYCPYYNICYECRYYSVTIMNLPCNHLTHCHICAKQTKMCPICYGTIINTMII